MRKDILINVNSENNKFKIDNKILGITSENLQGKIIFKPEPFVDGVCRLYVDGKGSILMDKQEDCYTVNILSSLLTEDSLDICFKITEPEIEDGIPIFCSKIMHFRVLETIESSSTIPEDYPSWEQVLDSMMAKIEQMESDAEDRLDEIVGQIQDLTSAYNTNATNKTNAFNTNATNKTTAFNQNYASKVTEIDGAVNSAKTELDDYTEDKKDEIDGSVDDLKSELDTYETAKEGELDSHTSTKKTELNTYTNSKKSDLDDYEETKETALNTLAGNLTSAFNSNANSKTSDFNDNATSKTGDFNTNATNKTSAYDENASTKLGAYNTNHTTKLAEYNSNATSKVSDYNTNATTKTSEFDQNASDKTDDFDDNASEKTTAFNDNATAKIAEYDAHVSELQSQVDDLTTLVETELESNEVDGTEIDVSDSAEYPGKIIPGANLEQKQLSGKNLLPIIKGYNLTKNGITITIDEDDVVTINGTCTTDNTTLTIFDEFDLKAGTYYANFIYLSGTMQNNTSLTRLHFADENWANPLYRLLTMSNGVSSPLVLSNGVHYKQRIIRLNAGEIFNNYKFKVQITETASDFDYEPYCGGQASPNPDYPQSIKVVTGDNVVKHVGKNLLNLTSITENTSNQSANLEKGLITISWDAGFNLDLSDIISNLDSSKIYTISFKHKGDALYLRNKKDNSTNILGTNVDSNYTTYSLNLTNINEFQFRFVRKSNTGTAYIRDIQIEQGSTATPYEPYREEEYELSLGNIELCKIGDYSDILFKNVVGDENYNSSLTDGAWYKKKIIDKKILTDLLNWSNNGTNRFSVEITAPNGDYGLSALCDRYIQASSWANHLDTDKNFIVRNGNWGENKCRISFRDSDYSSLTDWKQFVSENNLTVYHELPTPTYEQITDPTLISQLEALRKAKWYKEVNHWWTETENLEPVLKGTYKQSNLLRLQALEQAVVSLGGV